MVDTQQLMKRISERGLKLQYVSEQMGLSRPGFSNKLYGRMEFKVSEVLQLSRMLELSPEERNAIFFKDVVEK